MTLRFADLLLMEFDRESGLTRRLLTRLPADQLAWRPHERSMTLGRLATHLADLPGWGVQLIERPEFDLASRPADEHIESTAGAIVSLFDANTRAARVAVVARTDAELLAPWTLRRAGVEVFTVPRLVALRTLLLQHATHHRGQLSVYLRLLNVPLPPLYGPSADEGAF